MYIPNQRLPLFNIQRVREAAQIDTPHAAADFAADAARAQLVRHGGVRGQAELHAAALAAAVEGPAVIRLVCVPQCFACGMMVGVSGVVDGGDEHGHFGWLCMYFPTIIS